MLKVLYITLSQASQDGKTVYIKIHAPWEVLACGAEEMMMKMPTIVSDSISEYW